MNIPNNTINNTPVKTAAINGLAVVGFLALIIVGISLAVYSTRFVPAVVNRIGSAAVYLGSVFNPAPPSTLSVVPTSTSTTIFFNNANPTATTSTATSTGGTTAVVTTPKTPAPPKATTGGTYQIQTTPVPVAPHGLADFSVKITGIGYLSSTSIDSFVGAGTVPSGNRPAIKFTVTNTGTNWSGRWRFNASIPTNTSYTYESDFQQSLAPGDSIDFTLGFDQPKVGSNQPVTITVNYDRAAIESDYGNNTATAPLNIQ